MNVSTAEYVVDSSTVDTGPWLVVSTAIFCTLSIALLPCIVTLGRRHDKRRSRSHESSPQVKPSADAESNEETRRTQRGRRRTREIDSSLAAADSLVAHGRRTTLWDLPNTRTRRRRYYRSRTRGPVESERTRKRYVRLSELREIHREDTPRACRGDNHDASFHSDVTVYGENEDEPPSLDRHPVPDRSTGVFLNEAKAMKEGDETFSLFCGDNAWWRPSMMAAGFDTILEIAEWDRDMKRINELAVSLSLAALSEGVFNIVTVALVANFLGTDAVAAYTIVDLILGLADEFFLGFALSGATLYSQAIGSHNSDLAGQYVQISWILYSLCMIPNVIIWMFFTYDMVLLFGFNEATAQMAQDYAPFFLFTKWLDGLDEAYSSLLEIVGHEKWTTFMGILAEAVTIGIVVAHLLTQESTLVDVGLIQLSVTFIYFGLNVAFTMMFGWVKRFTKGMFGTFALRNSTAVETVFKTALPLSLGQVLQYGQWEVLTFFVAAIGPAEVTAWGIAGSLWDFLEALTEAFGDAGEIRVAYHLGASNPERARLSAYKTILVAVLCATLFTSVMWIIGDDLAVWLTPDAVLQYLIVEILPLIGIGNVTMTAGTVSWALVGAQGRYRLATTVAFICSWCTSLPLAAIFTYVLNIGLQGTTSAVVIGDSVTGTCLIYILIRSDWEDLSRKIVGLTQAHTEASTCQNEPSSEPGAGQSETAGSIQMAEHC